MATRDAISVFDGKTISYTYEASNQRAANDYVTYQADTPERRRIPD